ncbi:MAG: efflux transporter outer membrane subunit [Sedimentisphaerales bacterium]|nr:efflux transporter outer membrane subunit [Sedimentisphaerales bacterium]NLT75699.1 efflux transporter outer membrane subunit [Planctomycetota bacterium]
MKTRILLSLIGIVICVAGCRMAPKYMRPEPPIPVDWPTGQAYAEDPVMADAPVASELPWREFFTDPKLHQVIETALENNHDLRLAALNVELARSLYGIQRQELYPSLYATAGGGEQRASADLTPPGQPRTTEQYSVSLGILSWEIDFFGRLHSLKDRALQEYLATEQGRRSAQVMLISSVANGYLALAADRDALALAEETLQVQEATYGLVKRQYEIGVATELDLRRAQIPMDTARGDVAYYTQRVAQDQNALNLLVGCAVSEDFLPSELASIRALRDLSPGLPSDSLLGRPDIIAAEHQLRAAYANIGAARAAFFPRISLTTTLGTASDELSGLFKSGSGTWSYAGQAVMPIFDARTWSAYEVTKVQREMALVEYEKAIQIAFQEVADALAVRGTVDRQIAAQQSLVHAAEETYRLSFARYERGLDNYLSVLDAQRSLYAAQQALVYRHLTKLANHVRLYATLGGGGDVPDGTSEP